LESTAFYIVLFIHLSGLILGFGSVMVTDLYGTLWLWDRVRFPQVVRVAGVTEIFVWMGWGTMVAAGIPLLVLKGVVDDLMIVKLFFVALIGVNGVFLYRIRERVKSFEHGSDVPRIVMFRAVLSLAVSQIAWWGALTIGFLHRHVQSVIEWPPTPWLASAGIAAVLLLVWATGEAVFRARA